MVFQIEFLRGKTIVHKIAADCAGVQGARDAAALLMGSAHPWTATGYCVRTAIGGIVARWPDL
jgi:hypothetical protein